MRKTGLHLLLGISDPALLNYDRLVDTLQAAFPHWQTIAAEVTLNAVEQFGLNVQTVHYDLTSICFCGQYSGSSWVEFGYSRDHRPDLPQINIGLSATADGKVVLPGGSGIHPGNTNDATTTVPNYQKLQKLFERSDILVTGDRIMQSAGNMLTIARAHSRFLGPVDWTPDLRGVVAACRETEFQELPASSARRGYPVKAVFRRVRNLKSDLPIRPLYAHRDDVLVALCFVSLLSLTLYTLIERDVQADPQLVASGLRTTDVLLAALSGWALTAFYTPSGYVAFWFDMPTAVQQLIAKRLRLLDPGTRMPRVRQAHPNEDQAMPDVLAGAFQPVLPSPLGYKRHRHLLAASNSRLTSVAYWAFSAIVKVLFVMLCWKSISRNPRSAPQWERRNGRAISPRTLLLAVSAGDNWWLSKQRRPCQTRLQSDKGS